MSLNEKKRATMTNWYNDNTDYKDNWYYLPAIY